MSSKIDTDYPNFKAALAEFGEEYCRRLKDLLEKDGRKSSGTLLDSIDFHIDIDENEVIISLLHANHFPFINEGRGKTKNHGTGVVREKIYDWLITKQISTPQDKEFRGLWYAITKSIHQNGFPGGVKATKPSPKENGVPYTKYVMDSMKDEWLERFRAALFEDILGTAKASIEETLSSIFANNITKRQIGDNKYFDKNKFSWK